MLRSPRRRGVRRLLRGFGGLLLVRRRGSGPSALLVLHGRRCLLLRSQALDLLPRTVAGGRCVASVSWGLMGGERGRRRGRVRLLRDRGSVGRIARLWLVSHRRLLRVLRLAEIRMALRGVRRLHLVCLAVLVPGEIPAPLWSCHGAVGRRHHGSRDARMVWLRRLRTVWLERGHNRRRRPLAPVSIARWLVFASQRSRTRRRRRTANALRRRGRG